MNMYRGSGQDITQLLHSNICKIIKNCVRYDTEIKITGEVRVAIDKRNVTHYYVSDLITKPTGRVTFQRGRSRIGRSVGGDAAQVGDTSDNVSRCSFSDIFEPEVQSSCSRKSPARKGNKSGVSPTIRDGTESEDVTSESEDVTFESEDVTSESEDVTFESEDVTSESEDVTSDEHTTPMEKTKHDKERPLELQKTTTKRTKRNENRTSDERRRITHSSQESTMPADSELERSDSSGFDISSDHTDEDDVRHIEDEDKDEDKDGLHEDQDDSSSSPDDWCATPGKMLPRSLGQNVDTHPGSKAKDHTKYDRKRPLSLSDSSSLESDSRQTTRIEFSCPSPTSKEEADAFLPPRKSAKIASKAFKLQDVTSHARGHTTSSRKRRRESDSSYTSASRFESDRNGLAGRQVPISRSPYEMEEGISPPPRQSTNPASMALKPPLKTKHQKSTRKSGRCKRCQPCQLKENCGRCVNCKDKRQFGGDNTRKQKCIAKRCQNFKSVK